MKHAVLRKSMPHDPKESFDGGVVIAVALAAHGRLEATLTQELLIFVRAKLAAANCMMDAAVGWLS